MTDDRFGRLQRLAEQYAIERDAFEAKDRKINELHARIAELEAALKPFIEAEALKHTVSTGTSYEHTIWEICVSEAAFRAAYAAYRG